MIDSYLFSVIMCLIHIWNVQQMSSGNMTFFLLFFCYVYCICFVCLILRLFLLFFAFKSWLRPKRVAVLSIVNTFFSFAICSNKVYILGKKNTDSIWLTEIGGGLFVSYTSNDQSSVSYVLGFDSFAWCQIVGLWILT